MVFPRFPDPSEPAMRVSVGGQLRREIVEFDRISQVDEQMTEIQRDSNENLGQ